MKEKTKRILVIVVKWRHHANDLLCLVIKIVWIILTTQKNGKSEMIDTFSLMPFSVLDFFILLLLGGVYRHDAGATFAPVRVHSDSISWLCICLHDTITKCHAGASHPGVSSLRFLYRGENFTPVRNLATVSCKRETTNRFGVKSVCR